MSFLGGFNNISNMFGEGVFGAPMQQGMIQATTTTLGNNALIKANDGKANLNKYADLGSPSSMVSLWSKFKED